MSGSLVTSVLRILALLRKELRAILKDPPSRASLFVPPILQCLIFGYAATYDLNHVPYAVLDQDHSAASHELLADLDGTGVFDRVAELTRESDIRDVIDRQRALIVIQVGQDFERQLQQGRAAPVQVIADGRNSNTAGTALGYISYIVASFNQQWAEEHGAVPDTPVPQVVATSRAWYNPNLETRWFMIPALIGTLSLIQTLMVTALSLAREREQGTFDQLLVTPFTAPEIIIGKALPSVLIGLIQATLILLVANFWFRIPFSGSYLTLYIGLALFLLAGVGIGLMLSAVVATMQQAVLYCFVIMMPLALLSGLSTPIANMPEVFQYLTLLDPLRYAIDLAHRVYLEGAGLTDLGADLWPMALIAAVMLAGTAWTFRRGFE